MRSSAAQSHQRFPLTGLLGQGGNVRVLRALARHGAALSVSQLARECRMSPPGIRAALAALTDQQVVVRLGALRSQLFELRGSHPLAGALRALFAAEAARWEAVTTVLRSALAAERGVAAAWCYGSVARGEDGPRSDLDLAVVVASDDVEGTIERLRLALEPAEDSLLFAGSLVGLSQADVLRLSAGDGETWWRELVRDAIVLAGPRPEVLAARLRRRVKAA